MQKITVSAPGKLMIMGEHAVVYGHPCIVTAVGQRMFVTVEILSEPVFELEAPDVQITGYIKSMSELGEGEIPKGAQFVEIAVKNFCEKHPISGGVRVATKSEFSSLFGFGSSSASTVCVMKGLMELTGHTLTNKELFDLSYKAVLDIQGKGSGFDVASAIYGGTIYFVTAGKTIEPLEVSSIPMIVGYSGTKVDTRTIIDEVKQKMITYLEKIERIYEAIEQLVEQAKHAFLESDWARLGTLMTFNQEYLRDLGVSTEKLEAMISASLSAGAYGAKLSGAGGGDCMIALVSEEKRKPVVDAITSVGGQFIDVRTNVEGVRVEK
jgi:mevalonate kinase